MGSMHFCSFTWYLNWCPLFFHWVLTHRKTAVGCRDRVGMQSWSQQSPDSSWKPCAPGRLWRALKAPTASHSCGIKDIPRTFGSLWTAKTQTLTGRWVEQQLGNPLCSGCGWQRKGAAPTAGLIVRLNKGWAWAWAGLVEACLKIPNWTTCSRGLLAASPGAARAEESEEEPVLPAACSLAFPSTGHHPSRQGRVFRDSQQLTPQAPGSSPHQGLLDQSYKVKVMSLGAGTCRSEVKPCLLLMWGGRTRSFWKGEGGSWWMPGSQKWEWVAEPASVSRPYTREVRLRTCTLMGAVTLSGDGVSLPALGRLRRDPLCLLGDSGHDFSCAFDTQDFCD